MATALAVTPLEEESARDQSERLGAEITELCSYIYAAEQGALIVKALEMAMEKDFVVGAASAAMEHVPLG